MRVSENGEPEPIADPDAARQQIAALEQAVQFYRRIADLTFDWECLETPDHSLLYVSPACERITGYTPQDFLDDPGLLAAIIHPDDLPAWQTWQHNLEHNRAASLFEFRLWHRDGSLRWIEQACQPVYHHDGVLDGYRLSKRDITARKQQEARKAEVHQISRLGSWEWDVATKRLAWSDEVYQIFGVDPASELTYSAVKTLIRPADRENNTYQMQRLLDGEDMVSYEGAIERPDGTTRFLRHIARASRDENGQITRLFGAVQDITEQKQAELELRASEERLRALFDNAPVLAGITDLTGRWTQASRCFKDVLGYSPEELYQKHPSEITHPDDMEVSREQLEKLLAGEIDRYRLEKRYICKDSSERWVDLTVTALHINSDVISGALGVAVDITERKRTEIALRESEARYRDIFQHASLGIFRTTLDGRLLDANPSLARMFGYDSPQEMIPALTNIAEQAYVYPEKRAQDIQAAMQSDHSITIEEFFLRRDGKQWIGRLHLYVVQNEDGTYSHLEGFIEDITERKKAEAALRESEGRFRAIFEHAKIGIALFDSEGRLLRSNPMLERILGYSEAEMIRLGVERTTHPDDWEQDRDQAIELLAGQRDHYELDKRYIHKNGQIVWGHLIVTLVRDAEGQPLFCVSMVEDITERKRAEIALRENEDTFRRTFEAIPDPALIWQRGPDGVIRLVRFNTAAVEKTQGHLVNYQGVPVEEFFKHDPRVYKAIQRVLETGEPIRDELYYQLGTTGEYKWLIADFTSISHDQVLNINRDITEQKLAEQVLRESEETFRRTFEAISDSALMWQRGADGVIRLARFNAAALANSQGHLVEYQGIPAEEFFGHAPRVYDHIRHVLETGEPVQDELYYQMVTTGEHVWLISDYTYVSHDQVLNINRDITGRKLAEQVLRESENRYRTLFEQLHDAVLVIDVESGTIIDANNQALRLTKRAPEDLIGVLNYAQLHAPSQISDIVRWFRVFTTYEQNSEIETEVMRADGSRVPVLISAARLILNGRTCVLGIYRDITERRQAENRALELAKEQEQVRVLQHFIGDASHDLKTPLTTMKLSLYLWERINDPATRAGHLEVLKAQTMHLERLLENMLDMSRLDQPGGLEFAPIQLAPLVRQVLQEQEAASARKNQTVIYQPAEEFASLEADYVELSRAVRMLVTNAITYTPKGGRIVVHTTIEENQAIIEVEDTGIGISAKDLPHIFKRFFRTDEARQSDTGGSGLGLAITKKVAEGHGGCVEVESQQGVGSTFRIVLPTTQKPHPNNS